ncbi:DUF4442 domain-containing protein [Chitinophaga sp. GCM10012297]|uniref:DUF4442 domain-containing protein n=1 Tax=Chitinophaga chungangae TaxID=2821488 RepID=A0ABS3YCC5_9BACT|nr:DUF4442 domain-containing protein [Chitinophaga chungangae]MBO9152321.1 DUF4442 domain-containing protein [Chitinophaga chungangae]
MGTPDTTERFIALVNNRFKFSLFLLYKLPSAWMAGVRVRRMSAESCTTVVPYRWLSQNPFRSTYFACLAMAAEMSSGLLAMAHANGAPAKVSMLVTGMEGIFLKKAKNKTYFTCDAGENIQHAINQAVQTGEPSALTVQVAGVGEDGAEIARFMITWSFKKISS